MESKTRKEIVKEIEILRQDNNSYCSIGKKINLDHKSVERISKNGFKNLECIFCGKDLLVKSKEHKYCNSCQEKIKPNGGREMTRELARIRDNHTCQICGKKWKEGTRRFDVHHKDCKKEKTRQCDSWQKEKDNLITLCHKCHLNIDNHANKKSY